MSEATPEFKQRLQEAFDEMHVGQTFTFRRTFTGGDVAMFCGVTGDYNPYHQDEAFARESPHGRLTTFRDFSQEACSRTSGASWGSSPQRCPIEYQAPVYVETLSLAQSRSSRRTKRNVGSRRAPATSIRTASNCSGRGSPYFLVASA